MHDVKEGEWFEKDITKVSSKSVPIVDLWTAGFPCQDVSVSGGSKRRGLLGDRSGLFFELIRILWGLDPDHRPRWIALENVKGLFSSGDSLDFAVVLSELAALGYGIEWSLTNSKNFGLAQNRERVYIICDSTSRSTGKIFPLGRTNPAALNQIAGRTQGERIYGTDGLAPTQTSNGGGFAGKTGLFLINTDNEKGVIFRDVSNCIDASYAKGLNSKQRRTGVLHSELPRAILNPSKLETRQNGRRIKEENEIMFTILASEIPGVLQNSRIRRLTPRECFRLQGVEDNHFDKVAAVCSDAQLYRQAGNAVSVNVVYEIAKRIRDIVNEENEQSMT
jgi:DNA (cytosine-5)-methyltransferase 1